jgi:hypothetical protein
MSREARQVTDVPEGDHPPCSAAKGGETGTERLRPVLDGMGAQPPCFHELLLRFQVLLFADL